MFILAKLFWIIAQPLCFAFLMIALGFLAAALKRRVMATVFGVAGLVVFFVALFTSAGIYLVQDLEDRFPRPAQLSPAPSCFIVLGGGIDTEPGSVRGGYSLNDDGDRYVEVVRLARLYPEARIIMSGGDGSIDGGHTSEAEIIGRMFADFGIAADRVSNDATSRDTFENAMNTKAILAQRGLSRCLLITSGFHMPRAVAIFRHLGMDVIPWVTDYRSTGKETLRLDVRYPVRNAAMLTVATKEWIGMLAYYATGRLSSLYPTPE